MSTGVYDHLRQPKHMPVAGSGSGNGSRSLQTSAADMSDCDPLRIRNKWYEICGSSIAARQMRLRDGGLKREIELL